jgi:pSer/pThr/pTyr-binding forkhead associated (FHA) protein
MPPPGSPWPPGQGFPPPPGGAAPWPAPPSGPTTHPTGPTLQTVSTGTGAAPDDPTVVTPPEVLEPTVRAPETPPVSSGPAMAQGPFGAGPAVVSTPYGSGPAVNTPETLEPTVIAPPAPVATQEPVPTFSSPSLATQAAVDPEEAEPTVTMIDEVPAKLIVTRNGQAREFVLKKPDITIGRAPSNDVALSGDQLASRRHALIRFDGVNFTIRDVGSANGTYINGVEVRAPTSLRNGDHIGVGEHEIVFFTVSANEEVEPETTTFPQPMQADQTYGDTVPVSGLADTIEPSSPWATRGASGTVADGMAVVEESHDAEVDIATETGSEYEMAAPAEDAIEPVTVPPPVTVLPAEAPSYSGPLATPQAAPPPPVVEMPEATIIERIEITPQSQVEVSEEEEEEDALIPEPVAPVKRFQVELIDEEAMPLPVPQLPEIPSVLSAIKSLDTTTAEMREHLRQAKALEEQAQQLRDQLRVASDAISSHDNSVAVLAQRLRVGVANVSNQLSKVIEEVTRADESLSIADLVKLIDDVRSDPRDIYTLGSLARRARELAQFFEMHQHVNQILSECLATLNGLLSADLAKPEGQD